MASPPTPLSARACNFRIFNKIPAGTDCSFSSIIYDFIDLTEQMYWFLLRYQRVSSGILQNKLSRTSQSGSTLAIFNAIQRQIYCYYITSSTAFHSIDVEYDSLLVRLSRSNLLPLDVPIINKEPSQSPCCLVLPTLNLTSHTCINIKSILYRFLAEC